jgi:xanthine dehydrogenase molybdopterin-binding subunit B
VAVRITLCNVTLALQLILSVYVDCSKRGLCIQPNKYGLGWTGYTLSVFIAVSQIDGTISIKHGGTLLVLGKACVQDMLLYLSTAGPKVTCTIVVSLQPSHRVHVSPGCEMGQGSDIKMAQVVAYELGAPIELVKVEDNDSTVNMNNSITGGSSTSDVLSMGNITQC